MMPVGDRSSSTLGFALLGLFFFLLTAPAQAGGFIITVAGGADVPMAIPQPQTPEGDPEAVAGPIHDTLWRDLELSGYFTLLDPDGYIEQGKGVEPGTFTFDDWKVIKTHVLVKTRVLPTGSAECGGGAEKMCADVFLYYVIDGTKLASKRLRAPAGNARAMGHLIADTVLEVVTGQPGFFGSRIAAVRGSKGNKELYVLDLDGKGMVPVTRNGSINLSPAFHPAGTHIAWTTYKRGNPDLYVKDLVGGRTRMLSNRRGINVSPAWSPDGSQIALCRSLDGDSDIFLIDSRTGQEIRQITRGGGIDVAPAFSPDGSQLAFASERSGGSQVYVQPTDGGAPRRVTFQGKFNTDPVFSPDGTQLAFVARSDEGWFDVFVVDVDGRNLVRLTQSQGDNEDPSWSPDGRYLVFSSTRSGRSEIWLTTADGRHQMPITRSGGWTQPVWSPK